MLIEHLRNQMRERKVKVSDMMAQLDADGDGQLDRNELREGMRKLFEGKEAEGGAPVSVTDEMLEKVLDVFDSDRSGTVDAGEFNRAMWSSQRLLTKLNRTGGAGIFNVRGENRRSLRVSTEDLDQIGSRLIMEVVPHVALLINSDGSKRDLPAEERPKEDGQPSDNERLRKRLCQEMCRHFQETIRFLVSAQSGGFEAVRRKDFQIGMSKLYGMRPVDVGDVGAQMLRLATLALFDSWDIAHLGELDLIELMKVLRHGGSVHVPKGAPRDVIFQAEIASHELKARRTKQTAISAAKQALHGFVARTRDEQLHIRAERVAPVQLESLLSTMLQESGSLIDLFLRWDTDGDGTIGLEEFATAIMYLGFTFSKEVCTELFRFFDKDGSGTVNLEEIEATIKWGKERKPRMRALLPGWRQLSLDIDVNDQSQLVTRIQERLHELGMRPLDMFREWDESGNGTLDREELSNLIFSISGLDMSEFERDTLFDSFDKDHSGKITFKELAQSLSSEVPIEKLMKRLAEPDVMSNLFSLFNEHWDKDGDGVLTKKEFYDAMVSIGVEIEDEETMRGLFKMLDEDGSGEVSLKEFEHTIRWVRSCDMCQQMRVEAFTFKGTLSVQDQIKRALAANSDQVMNLFREWDANGDGVISLHEFLRSMPLIGIDAPQEDVKDLFREMDHDCDGLVTFREFKSNLRKVSEEEKKKLQDDESGHPFKTDWHPKTPPVAVVDLSALRATMKMEHRLRGLDRCSLTPAADPDAQLLQQK